MKKHQRILLGKLILLQQTRTAEQGVQPDAKRLSGATRGNSSGALVNFNVMLRKIKSLICKSNMKDDLHIAILKFGRDSIENGITFEELRAHIKNRGYEVNEERLKAYFWDNYETIDREKRGNPLKAIEEGLRFSLTIESTFRMIEYEEFKSANQSSRTATRFATAALVVSIISTGVSIFFSYNQVDPPTKIDQGQFEQILDLKHMVTTTNTSLSKIQKKQEEPLKFSEEQLGRILQLKFDDRQINQMLARIIETQKLQMEQEKQVKK